MTEETAGSGYTDELTVLAHRVTAASSLEVVVQREWNGWRTGLVHVTDLVDVHWRQPKGAPRPLIHAYVRCTDVVSGSLPHDASGSPHPHTLLVCVLKCHTAPDVFAQLALRASEAPTALIVEDRC